MKSNLFNLLKTTKGAGLVEYSLVVGLIAVLAIGSIFATGTEVKLTFCRVTDKINEQFAAIGIAERGVYDCSAQGGTSEPTVGGAPIARDDAATANGRRVTIDVLTNDSDPDGDTLSVTQVSTPSNGAVTINPDFTVTYNPALGYEGSDSFTYTVDDGTGGTDTATVSLTVNIGPGRPPSAIPSNASVYVAEHLYKNLERITYAIVPETLGEQVEFSLYLNGRNESNNLLVRETLTLSSNPTYYTVDLIDATTNPLAPSFDHPYGVYGEYKVDIDGIVQTPATFRNVEDDVIISSPLPRLHNDPNNGRYEHYYLFGTISTMQMGEGRVGFTGHDNVLSTIGTDGWLDGQTQMTDSGQRTFSFADNGNIYLQSGDYVDPTGAIVTGTSTGRYVFHDSQTNYTYLVKSALRVEVWNSDMTTLVAQSITYNGTNGYGSLLGARGAAEGPNHIVINDIDNDQLVVFDKGRTNMVGNMNFLPSRVIDTSSYFSTSGSIILNDDTIFFANAISGTVTVYAFNANTGAFMWSFDNGSFSNGYAASYQTTGVLATDTTLYVPLSSSAIPGIHEYRLYDADTGDVLRTISIEDKDIDRSAANNSANTDSFIDGNGHIWSSFDSVTQPYGIPEPGAYWVRQD